MSSKKIKVLFLSSWFPSRINQTKGNFVEKHLQAVSEFCETAVLHVVADQHMNQKTEISLSKHGQILYLIIYFKPSKVKIPFLSGFIKLKKYISNYFKGYKIITKGFGKPDIVHGNILFPVGIIAYLFKKFKKIPYVFTEHWTGYTQDDPNHAGKIELIFSRIIALNAEMIMPVSEHLKNSMINIGLKANYEVIPNVVNTEIFKPDNENVKSEIKKILHISTLIDEQKNFTGILNVLSKLKKARNDFELEVITDGDSEQYMKKSNELGLQKVVNFSGLKNAGEIAEIMKLSSFLLLFSNYENLPCVIVEAFAAGLPVVSTDVGGIKEHLNDKNGLLIPKGDEAALLEAINKMLDSLEKFDKNVIAGYAKENFSYSKIGSLYSGVYNNCLFSD